MAKLSSDPAWKFSSIYQIGLCFERLQKPRRALEAYRYIVNAQPAPSEPAGGGENPPPAPSLESSLKHLKESAAWRAEHIEWMVDVVTKLYPILSTKVRRGQPLPSDNQE